MLQSSHMLTRAHPRPPICPSCRLQAQRRARHASVQHAEHATGPHALAEELPRKSRAARAPPWEVEREQGQDKQEAGWDGAMVTDLAGENLFRRVAASAAFEMSPPWPKLRERYIKAANPSLAAAVEAEKASGMQVAAVELDEQPQAVTRRQPVREQRVRAAAGIPSIRRQWETPFAAKMAGESEQSHDRDAVAGCSRIRRQAGVPRSIRGNWGTSRSAKMAEQMRSLDEEAVAGVTLIRTQQGTALSIRKQQTPLAIRKQQAPPVAAKLAGESEQSHDRDAVAAGPLIRRQVGIPRSARGKWEASRGAKMAEQMRSLDEEAVAGVTLNRTQQGTPLTIGKQQTPLTIRKQQAPPVAAKLAEESDPSIEREWGTPSAAGVEEEAKQSQLEDILDELMSASPDGQLGGSGAAALEEGSGAQQLTHDGMAELSPLELLESSHGATRTATTERGSFRPETVTTVTLDSADSGFLDALGKPEVRQQAAVASTEMSRSSPGSVRPPHVSTGLAWQRAPAVSDRSQARAYHISHRSPQQQVALEAETSGPPPELFQVPHRSPENPNGIRAQLRRWQEVHGHENRPNMDIELGADEDADGGDLSNNLTRLPEDNDSAIRNTPAEQEDNEREAMAHFTQASSEEPSSAERNTRFLQMGDLVEIEYLKSETPNTVAVFVRRIDGLALAQMYTKQGRWIHVREKIVQYAIPGWVTEDLVKPLLQYLPSEEVLETGLEELMEQAYMKDLSVPREIAAPLVSRMVQFDVEAKDVYLKHARTLDNAHQLLAHDTDLRYGSLVSAATTLLRTPAEKLPMPALFAVRQALSNAGFAFSMDRNSHRLTGYLQIRSKEQVRMVENVRNWLREWQDDLAMTATLSAEQRRRHKPRRGAIHVYDFLDKVRAIIRKSRQDREPTIWGNVGPSKVRIPITPEQDCVRITQEETFNAQDTELVRFMEAWSLSMLFNGLPRILALPPLLLQATGLYENYDFIPQTGMLMLQEIGTVLPYENRVRFDQHLLLPSSQHSRPLQNLMTSLLEMAKNHDFKDSMEDLRHDWGSMPVFCIDEAGAHEIDDGLSVEPAAIATDGTKEWWVHVHIANPTAFFERDHPLAKMARHMGESIYMPERTYMMMPRWSTQRHFSLAPGRPCLTFSARLDVKGRMLEHKIQNGRVKRVLRLTPEDVAVAMGKAEEGDGQHPELTLTVGGEVPPERKKRNAAADLTPEMVEQLKVLNLLGDRRRDVRKAAGGMFFDSHSPSVNVWQSSKMSGLAWDNPYRKGWRHVEGDPVIQMKTRGLINWFAPAPNPVKPLVTEMMLLACEVSAAWCKERAIPAVFRGSIQRPGRMDPDQFFKQVLSPIVAKDPKGEIPMHIGMRYLETFGTTGLSVSPFRHKILGMDNYGKVTSPLRRYGDMILHWQIEAALREEARTGRSLVTNRSIEEVDRRFLPFSANVLNTIIVGLQPRESMIMRAKSHADSFWMTQLLFRAHEFGETALPFGKTVRAYVHGNSAAIRSDWGLGCILMELNIMATMLPPTGGQGLSAGTKADGLWGRLGDVWECEIHGVHCFRRIVILKPVRLLERVDV